MEGVPGLGSSMGQAMEVWKYIPCFETRRIVCMACGLIRVLGLMGRDRGWENGHQFMQGLIYCSQESEVNGKLEWILGGK